MPNRFAWATEGGQRRFPNYTKILFEDGREPILFDDAGRFHTSN
ncbi:MAG: hypothetical protein WBB22_00650 [Anaerolineae bacterium]